MASNELQSIGDTFFSQQIQNLCAKIDKIFEVHNEKLDNIEKKVDKLLIEYNQKTIVNEYVEDYEDEKLDIYEKYPDIANILKQSRLLAYPEQDEINSKKHVCFDFPKYIKDHVIIGPNGTEVSKKDFKKCDWTTSEDSIQTLLCNLFQPEVLATHTLSGETISYDGKSHMRMKLDPFKISDIVHCVRVKTGADKDNIIATITDICTEKSQNYSS